MLKSFSVIFLTNDETKVCLVVIDIVLLYIDLTLEPSKYMTQRMKNPCDALIPFKILVMRNMFQFVLPYAHNRDHAIRSHTYGIPSVMNILKAVFILFCLWIVAVLDALLFFQMPQHKPLTNAPKSIVFRSNTGIVIQCQYSNVGYKKNLLISQDH